MSKELIERLRTETFPDLILLDDAAYRIEELERKVASRDAEVASLTGQRNRQIDTCATRENEIIALEKECDQLREELSRARLQNVVIYGASHPEIYKTKEDQLREHVKMLRDALKHAVLYVPELGTVPGISQALSATEPT